MSWLIRSLLIFLGAGIGGNLRYWIGVAILNRTGAAFPWNTFIVNISGSFCIGIATGFLLNAPGALGWRLFIVVGILGGYTTFSSFSMETIQLIKDRNIAYAFGNVLGSCALSLVACWLGLLLAEKLRG